MPVEPLRSTPRYAPWREQLLDQWNAALDELAVLDAQLLELASARVHVRELVAKLRDRAWPPGNILFDGRQPPLPGRAPLAPARDDARRLRGYGLRMVALAILDRHGPLRLADLHSYLHLYGYAIAGDDAVKHLADCLRYELHVGRAVRCARGVYAAHAGPPTKTWWDVRRLLPPVDTDLRLAPMTWSRGADRGTAWPSSQARPLD